MRLGSSLVMTRLLQPDAYGVMAIVWMITFVLALLSDVGLRQHAVQSHRGDDPLFLDTAWVVQILRGLTLWVVTVLIGLAVYFADSSGFFPADSVYAAPVLPSVIVVGGFTFVIAGFQSTKMWTADRTFDQKRPVQIELISQAVGLVLMVPFGFATNSIWTLVLGSLAASITTTWLSHAWMTGPRNRFRTDRDALRELRHFGRWVFVSSAISVFASQGDRLLLGYVVDAHTLGLYSIASLIVGTIATAVGKYSGTVSLPALSEVVRTAPSQLRRTYYQLRLPMDVLLLFLMGLLYSSGGRFVDFLFDSRYAGAGDMLQLLALSLFATRYDVGHQVYLALGLPRYVAMLSVVRCLSLYILVPTLYMFGGVRAAILGIALHYWVTLPFVYGFNVKLRLMSVRDEIWVLVGLPIGLLCGAILNALVH
jgi:O-antigen/teichoic acid export membrane protein